MHGVGVSEPAVQVRGLGVRYDATVAVQDVSLTVDAGEMVALVGPNGAGKSSLLHGMLGLVAHEGDVVLHGRTCSRRARTGVAYVAQRRDMDLGFPITVEQVVATGRRPFRRLGRKSSREDRQAVARALSRVGLDGLERRAIGELSGGQAQRAFLARALAQEADVLLLDEPLTGVDGVTADALVDLLSALCDGGATVLLSTHDLTLVRSRFERVVALNRHIVGDGAPADVLAAERLERIFLAA